MQRVLTAAMAALTLLAASAPAIQALAQGHGQEHGGGRAGGGQGGGDLGGGRNGGGDNRGGGGRGGDNHGGRDRGGFGGLGAGMALGAALGYYAGRPYYCRDHHHWRWSPRQQRYVYYYNGGYC